MAAGDVTAELVEDFTIAAVATAVTNLRTTANDKWLMTSVHNGQDKLHPDFAHTLPYKRVQPVATDFAR